MRPSSGRAPRRYFASNEGWGIFELQLPLAIPASCWNTGLDTASHAVCASSAANLTWSQVSEDAASNDGLNCPLGVYGQSTYAPTTAPTSARPTYAPSIKPTTREPSYAPSTTPTLIEMTPFDCEIHYDPVQVLREDDDEFYEVVELDAASGSYETLYKLDYVDVDTHVNAVAMYEAEGIYYAMASIGGYLCSFDDTNKKCFDTPLEQSKPNVGCILDDRYYYAKEPGKGGDRRVYWVEGLASDPTFHSHDDATFAIGGDLFEGSVLDFVALKETSTEFIDDDEAGASYLLGLGQNFEVLVVRLDDHGAPDVFAVVPGAADWGEADEEDGASAFGAAFLYRSDDWAIAKPYFASNEGWGIFELGLPLSIPEDCWNAGFQTDDHVACDETASLGRVLSSEEASSNDGLNCPLGDGGAFPSTHPTRRPSSYSPTTATPSAEPAPRPTSAEPTYAPSSAPTVLSVDPFDCYGRYDPVQVLQRDDDEPYAVVELDVDSGEYVRRAADEPRRRRGWDADNSAEESRRPPRLGRG